MKLFNLDSPLWVFLTRVADLIILNLVWLVFCIPVFTIGASTTAMYRVTLNLARGEGGSVLRTFWEAFKLNFKYGTLIFLVLLLPTLLVIYEAWMFFSGAISQTVWMGVVFCFPLVIMTMILTYVYPLLAQFDNTVMNTIKNACLLSIANLPYTLIMGILNLSAPLLFVFATVFFLKTSIFWVFIGGALVAQINAYILRRIFKKQFQLD